MVNNNKMGKKMNTERNRIKLVCLPYAGGYAQFYKNVLDQHVADYVDVVPIELPGHGMRFGEKLKNNIRDLLNDILKIVDTIINGEGEYALLGYSMGSRIIYGLYSEIRKRKWKLPIAMFFCASPPPTLAEKRIETTRNSLINIIKKSQFGKKILGNAELLDVNINILGADINVLNSFNEKKEECMIQCPIYVFNGNKEYQLRMYDSKWQKMSEERCDIKTFKGGHYFIYEQAANVAEVINNQLLEIASLRKMKLS